MKQPSDVSIPQGMPTAQVASNDSSTGGNAARRVFRPRSRQEVALFYAGGWGWLALPARGKQPIVKWSSDVLPALPPPHELAALWAGTPHANIAVLTGQRSGVAVADVDPRHGGTLAALWALGWPQHTPTARSGSGGWHVYAQCPPAGLASLPTYAPGIELKADGALVIAPPSTHPSTQRQYAWLDGLAPWQVPLASLPPAVLAHIAASAPAVSAAPAGMASVGSAGRDVGLAADEVRAIALRLYRKGLRRVREEGAGRNNTMFWLARQLQSLGFAQADARAWVRQFGEEVRYG